MRPSCPSLCQGQEGRTVSNGNEQAALSRKAAEARLFKESPLVHTEACSKGYDPGDLLAYDLNLGFPKTLEAVLKDLMLWWGTDLYG